MTSTKIIAGLKAARLRCLVVAAAFSVNGHAAETITITGELSHTISIDGEAVTVSSSAGSGIPSALTPFESKRFEVTYPDLATENASLLELRWRINPPTPILEQTWARFLKGPKEIVQTWTSFSADAEKEPPPLPGRRVSGRIFFADEAPQTLCYEEVIWEDENGDLVADTPAATDKLRCPAVAGTGGASAGGAVLEPFTKVFRIYYPSGQPNKAAKVFIEWMFLPATLTIDRDKTYANKAPKHPAGRPTGADNETNFPMDPAKAPHGTSSIKRKLTGQIQFTSQEEDACIVNIRWEDSAGNCVNYVVEGPDLSSFCQPNIPASCP